MGAGCLGRSAGIDKSDASAIFVPSAERRGPFRFLHYFRVVFRRATLHAHGIPYWPSDVYSLKQSASALKHGQDNDCSTFVRLRLFGRHPAAWLVEPFAAVDSNTKGKFRVTKRDAKCFRAAALGLWR